MKQVINGLTYNTETATEVGFASHLYPSDFRHYEETLYKTPRGRFFLAGKGGPMTRWAKSNGNTWYGSSGIQALGADDALEWCERQEIDAETIAEHFDIEEA